MDVWQPHQCLPTKTWRFLYIFIIYRGQNFIFDICSAPCELWRWESTLICIGHRCYVKVEVLFLDHNFLCCWPDMWSWYNVQLCQSPLLPHTIKIFISHADDVKPACHDDITSSESISQHTHPSIHLRKQKLSPTAEIFVCKTAHRSSQVVTKYRRNIWCKVVFLIYISI